MVEIRFPGDVRSWKGEVVRREDQSVDFWKVKGVGEACEVDSRLSVTSGGISL